jgi:hypothetical protein
MASSRAVAALLQVQSVVFCKVVLVLRSFLESVFFAKYLPIMWDARAEITTTRPQNSFAGSQHGCHLCRFLFAPFQLSFSVPR